MWTLRLALVLVLITTSIWTVYAEKNQANCAVIAYLNTDNRMNVYADAKYIGSDDNGWTSASRYVLPCGAKVLAIKAWDTGGPAGLLGSLSNGVVTNENWKCTTKYYINWHTTNFNDASWPVARSYGTNKQPPYYWRKVANIADNAKWIWTSDNMNHNVVYCRMHISNFAVCGTRYQRGRIVGGTRAHSGEFPWHAAIKYSYAKRIICGGTLINNEWVVTAAHCVDQQNAKKLQVVLGEVDRKTQDGREIVVGVKKLFMHPKYNSDNLNYDIALIQLDQKIIFGKYIKPACLPKTATPPTAGTRCFVTGFGHTQEGGQNSPLLKQAELPIVNRNECIKAYKGHEVTDTMICAGYPGGGTDSCKNDSGGPLVCELEKKQFHLTGVVSWGIGCARHRRYGVYADVASLKSWVEEKIK